VTVVERAAPIAVIGAGFGGLSAAIRAQELGAQVTVLEASSTTPSWSNSRMSGARYHIAYLSPLDAPERLVAAIMATTQGTARADLTHSLAQNARRSFEWVQRHGARFVNLKGARVIAPVRPNRPGAVWHGRGGDVMLRTMQREFVARGGTYLSAHRARSLHHRSGGIAGLTAEDATGATVDVVASAVIIADGGFPADADLLRRHARVPRPDLLLARGAATGRGDGLRMMLDAGAALVNGEALYAHLLHRDARTNPRLTPYPMIDKMSLASIVVRGDGCRFYDEQLGGVAGANRIGHLADPSNVWLIFDETIWWNEARLDQIVPPNPNLVIGNARIERAETAAELASRTGLPADALERTIDAFDVAARSGKTASLAIPRSGAPRPLGRPLYAIPLATGLTYTLGGPAVDGAARVLDADDRPIAGLYAVGSSAGGLSGGPKPGYAGGISVAFGLGILAGEDAVKTLSASNSRSRPRH
jgi:fumarate reductase flavoprotein subunit